MKYPASSKIIRRKICLARLSAMKLFMITFMRVGADGNGCIAIYARNTSSVGDWETDTMCFSKQRPGLSVQYERKLMLARIHKVKNKTAEETETAISDMAESVPKEIFKTLTFDNGKEGVCHTRIRDTFEIETYFC